MADVTFRDFAGALMANDDSAAGSVLQTLLGVDEAEAAAATKHFKEKVAASPELMMKAMSMRTAVEGKDEGGLASLVSECFGLSDERAGQAAKVVLARYE